METINRRLAILVLLGGLGIGQDLSGQQTTDRLNVVYRGATPGRIRGYEQDRGNYTDLIWPSSMAANYTVTMPKETATLIATENHAYGGQTLISLYRAGGTEASPSDISSSDVLGTLTAFGRISGSYSQLAGVRFIASSATTGSIDFFTNNGSIYAAKVRINADGHILPFSAGSQDVGDSGTRWRKGWFVDLDVSGSCTGCGGSPPITWTLETDDDILTMQHHLAAGTTARNILSQYSRGTNASPSAAVAGDAVFTEKWQYYAGGAYRDAGAIFVNVPSGATVSGTSSPGQVSIFGTKHGETAGTEVVRFGAQTFSETPNWGARFFTNVYPANNLTQEIGVFGAEWNIGWIAKLKTSGSTDIEFYPGNALRWTMDAADFGSLIPGSDAAAKIGSSTYKLHSIWSMAYNTYTHNSWGTQFNAWAADNSVYHRMTAYGTSYFPVSEYRKARGTEASPTALSDTDTISYSLFEGYSPAGAFSFSGYIQTVVDGTPSGSVVPAKIMFGTMNSSGTTATRLTIRASGDIEIPGNLTVSGTCTGCGSGGTPPIDWHLDSGSTVVTLGNHGTVSASQLTSRFSRGTNASPTDTVAGDLIGNHTFRYYAGGDYRDAAAIFVNATTGKTISGSSSPAHLAVYATAQFATSGTEVVRFGELGGSHGFGTRFNSTVYPSANLTLDLGAAGIEWLTAWVSRIRTTSTTSIEFWPGNAQRWNMTTTSGDFVPQTDLGPDIGNIFAKPSEIWARTFKTYSASGSTQSNHFVADDNLNIIASTFSNTASTRASIQMHRYRGSYIGGASAVQSGDVLGTIAWQGLGSSSVGLGAVIRAYAASSPGTNYVPTDIYFESSNSSGTLLQALIIRSTGEADFGYAVDAAAGFKYNGSAGLTQTLSVRKGDDSGSCTIVFEGGIVTSTSC